MSQTLEQSIQTHREHITRSTDAASNWRTQNNPGWELFCLLNAVKHSICVAVSQFDSPDSAADYLATEFNPAVFDRTCELIRELHINGSGLPVNTPPSGLFKLVLAVHAAWLLDRYADAKELAAVCANEDQTRFYQSDPLWRDYARGIAAVANGSTFAPTQEDYDGYDRHWAIYLELMAAIASGNDLSSAVAMVDESFTQRNGDKRLIGDGLDGDGTFPVKWDFRKHSLLRAVEHNTANAG